MQKLVNDFLFNYELNTIFNGSVSNAQHFRNFRIQNVKDMN